MGYQTEFRGALKFTTPLTTVELARLAATFGQDERRHPEWGCGANPTFYYVELVLLDDFSGLRWNGAEKTYGMADAVRFLIRWMRVVKPDFGLVGTLEANGEDWDDRWALVVNGDEVSEVRHPPPGQKLTCTKCGHVFGSAEATA